MENWSPFPPVRVTVFLFLVLGLGYGLFEKHFPITVGGNVTVGHLLLVLFIFTIMLISRFTWGQCFFAWLGDRSWYARK